MEDLIMNAREVAFNFCEWLIDMEYSSREDCENDIDEMIEDFKTMEKACPRMFNLLRDISDR
jgi:hypothetical protein